MKRKGHLLISLGLFFLLQAVGGVVCWSQTTERVSVDSAGTEGNNASNNPSISSDGRYVAFESDSDNLVVGDNNTYRDIFVRNRQTPTTTRVSVASGGGEGSADSSSPSISGDGRYVAFESQADDLIAGDTNLFPFSDILLHDRQTGATTLVSVDWTGAQGDGPSSSPSISDNGRYVAFESEADLVAGDISFFDIFVRDLLAGTTILVSVDWTGAQADGNSYSPSISADGRYVAFESTATDLLAVVTNGNTHIFVRDLLAGTTTIVSVDSVGTEGNGDSSSPSISGNGRYVAFESLASNLVAGDTNNKVDIFVRDRQTGISTIVSVDSLGTEGNGDSSAPAICADGQYVAFESDSDNLVGVDGNGFFDIFVYEGDALPPNTTQSEKNNSGGSGPCFIATAASDRKDF